MKGWWSSSGELWESFPESLWLPGVLHGVLLELPWWGRSIGRALEEPPDQNGTEPLGAHTSSIACGLNASHKQHCSWWGVAAASWSKQEGKEKSQDNTTTPYKHKCPHWILHLLFTLIIALPAGNVFCWVLRAGQNRRRWGGGFLATKLPKLIDDHFATVEIAMQKRQQLAEYCPRREY